jgi:Protein of unknown function (DUF2786)
MTKHDVVSKVQKLFELSKSSNPNEAALAASKAREFLSKHNLTMADLPADEIRNALHVVETSVEAGRLLRSWVKGLLVRVAEGFDCEHIIRRSRESKPVLSFIGTDTDTRVATSTFRFLYEELNRLADEALPGLKLTNGRCNTNALRYAYLEGAVVRIGERLREQTARIKDLEEHMCKDLVPAKRQVIHDYMRTNFTWIRKESGKKRSVSALAFTKGYTDAGSIDLRKEEDSHRADTMLDTG